MHKAYTHPLTERRNIKREGRDLAIFVCVKKTILPVDVFSCEQCVTVSAIPTVSEPGVPAVQKSQSFVNIFLFREITSQNKQRRAENRQKEKFFFIYTAKNLNQSFLNFIGKL
jgi:hypothetical protein